MEFVKVMEIWVRFRQVVEGEYPMWAVNAFFTANATLEDFETAERELLAWAEQHPERPRYTPEQVKTMRALWQLGMTHVALNESKNAIWATTVKPEWMDSCWCCYGDSMSLKNMWCLRDLIKDDTQPLDLLAALRDAGEEV
jgi:hypothetical protein